MSAAGGGSGGERVAVDRKFVRVQGARKLTQVSGYEDLGMFA